MRFMDGAPGVRWRGKKTTGMRETDRGSFDFGRDFAQVA
jgi:hypothetical protein